MNCHCGKSISYEECCGKFHSGDALPKTSEELMRSRYSAFVVKDIDYLAESLDPQNRHDFSRKDTETWANNATFTGLDIIKTEDNGNKGMVEFKAHYTIGAEAYVHHEVSTFRKQAGQWYYKSGKIYEETPKK
ncbi:hypothetical protein D3C87_1327110 [compost metagenome]